ncbi:MAG: hypothetical protein BWX70_03003 [Verrucomicrobia bacterium ADurb.Bin070]|nr:MAG: hypothetical protein BWX70_03003 [Verrucomicrobia bacterium ADurb.Bin070]
MRVGAFQAQAAILVEFFTVLDRDHVAGALPGEFETDPAGGVLSEIHQPGSGRERAHGDRLEALRDDARRQRGGGEAACGRGHHVGHHHLLFKVGRAGRRFADHFAFADAVKADWARDLTPGVVGHHSHARAVVVCDLKLRQHAREIAPRRVVKVPDRDTAHIVPAVSQQYMQAVFAAREQVGHVIGGVKHAAVEAGGGRVQDLAADAASVKTRFIETEAGDVKRGFAHRARDRKALFKGRRDKFAAAFDFAPGCAVRRACYRGGFPSGVREAVGLLFPALGSVGRGAPGGVGRHCLAVGKFQHGEQSGGPRLLVLHGGGDQVASGLD